jgi:hypothetical protein
MGTPSRRGNNDVALLFLVNSVPVQVAAPAGVSIHERRFTPVSGALSTRAPAS